MFSWFGKKKVTADLSFLGADMHSHLLPALDDGLQTMEETVDFIGKLQQLGYSKLICTPHIISDLHPNSPQTILPRLEEVKRELAKHNIPVTLEAAAEYMVDMEFEDLVKSGDQLLTFGDNHILIEMSYIAPSPNIESVIFELCIKGYQPIIAHPERYNYYHQTFEKYQRLIDLGCVMQVNLLSLTGYYGKQVKVTAERLIKQKMIHFAGTDMHHDRHMDALNHLSTKKEFYDMMSGLELRNQTLL